MDESGGTGSASRVFLIVPICSVKKRAVDYTLRQHVFIRMPTRCTCINERSLMTPKNFGVNIPWLRSVDAEIMPPQAGSLDI